ncbi:hypothetical protein BSKO_01759 [Bryopsis sp. KO-2023]|nr:hypothetical protein BSKO_01759 [Bryopsis sp. KO-2023]
MVRRMAKKKNVEIVNLLDDDSDSNPPAQSSWGALQLTPSQQRQPNTRDRNRSNAVQDLEEEVPRAEVINPPQLVDACPPENEAELCVHKKKISQFKTWLTQHPPAPQPSSGSRMILLSGPSGCGKSTLIRVMAKSFGYSVSEWTTPTLMLWSERNLLGDAGPGYVSKIGAFNQFVARAKYPCLELTKSSASGDGGDLTVSGGKIIVVDDLPHAHSEEAKAELIENLTALALSAQHPTVCVLTDPSQEKDATDSTRQEYVFQNDLKKALGGWGVEHISLPAVNQTNMMRILRNVAEARGLDSRKDRLKMMSVSANGDLRNALHTLQMGLDDEGEAPGKHAKRQKGKRARSQTADCKVGGMVQKDTMLSAFHVLGKILYNKRAEETVDASQEQPRKKKTSMRQDAASGSLNSIDECPSTSERKINQKYWRPKSNYDAEDIIAKSGMDAQQLSSFLSEHYLNFMKDDALEEASLAADYLCCADLMSWCDPSLAASPMLDFGLGSMPQKPLHQTAAESVAVRGVMFSNSTPHTKGGLYEFHAPKFKHIETAKRKNLESIRTVIGNNVLSCTEHGFAEVTLQMVRQLSFWLDLTALIPSAWVSTRKGKVVSWGEPMSRTMMEPGDVLNNLSNARDPAGIGMDYIEDCDFD